MCAKRLSQTAPGRQRCFASPTSATIIAACALGLVSSLVFSACCGRADKTAALDGQARERRFREGANKEKKTDMSNQAKNAGPLSFYDALDKELTRRGMTAATVCDNGDAVSRRVLEDYGAMFIADEHVLPPPVCVFRSEADVLKFQNNAKPTPEKIGGSTIELQPEAMRALLEAREEAIKDGLNITPRGGVEAARRSYEDTRRLWDTRFLPALVHWQQKGRLTKKRVAELRALPVDKQVAEVLELEKTGIYFSKDLSKSILYSIAAPGTSQHIAMLALDVEQFADARVRRILARHGWFQTVKSDLPHFTYLGVAEEKLPSLGLREEMSGDQKFWIPNV